MCLCRSECGGGPCLLGDDSTLSSPVAGRHFRPSRDGGDVTGRHALASCHDDACLVAKSLLTHDDAAVVSTSTMGVRSPHAHLIYESRPGVVAPGCNSVHAVVFSSKRDQQQNVPTSCDCVTRTNDNNDDDDDDDTWRVAQSSAGDDDVQYYVIDRRRLASAMRLTTSSAAARRTSPITDDVKQLKQLRLKASSRTDHGDTAATTSLVGECRPLLVLSPGECCKNQRYSPDVPASVDNSCDSANS